MYNTVSVDVKMKRSACKKSSPRFSNQDEKTDNGTHREYVPKNGENVKNSSKMSRLESGKHGKMTVVHTEAASSLAVVPGEREKFVGCSSISRGKQARVFEQITLGEERGTVRKSVYDSSQWSADPVRKKAKRASRAMDDERTTMLDDETTTTKDDKRTKEASRQAFLDVATKRCALLTGEPTQDVAEWFENFEHVAKWAQQDEASKVWVCTSFISGPALCVFKSMGSEKPTFVNLRAVMFDAFVKNSCPEYARVSFETCKQGETESVGKFFHRLTYLGERAFPLSTRECLETDLAYRFLYGLRPGIAGLLSALGPRDTVHARVLQAQRIEASQERYSNLPAVDTKVNAVGAAHFSDLEKLQKQLTALQGKIDASMQPLVIGRAQPSTQKTKKSMRRRWRPKKSGENGARYVNPKQNTGTIHEHNVGLGFSKGEDVFQGRNNENRENIFYSRSPPHPVQYYQYPDQCTAVPDQNYSRLQDQNIQVDPHESKQSSKKGHKRKDRNNIICAFCSKRGHEKAECREFKWEFEETERRVRLQLTGEMSQQPVQVENVPQSELPTANVSYIEGVKAGITVSTSQMYSFRVVDNSVKPAASGIQVQQAVHATVRVSDNAHMRELSDEEKELFKFPAFPPVRIAAKLNMMDVVPLCDTGAQVSIITHALVEKIFHYSYPKKVSDVQLLAANCECLPVYGKLQFYLQIGEQMFPVEAYIVETLNDEMILGSNFLGHPSVRAIVDVYRQTISIGGVEHALLTDGKASQRPSTSQATFSVCHVRTTKAYRIPAKSYRIIESASELGCPESSDYMIEPDQGFSDETDLWIASSMFDVSRSTIPLRVFNPSEKPKVIPANTYVATATPVLAILNQPVTHSVESEFLGVAKNMADSPLLHKSNKEALEQFLIKHRKVFALDSEPLGVTHLVQHEIDTGTAKPFKRPPFRTPVKQREMVDAEVEKMLRDGVIKRSKSPWSAPMFLVLKKDGTWRPVVDYRGLNTVTKTDVFPLPRIDDYIDALGDAKFFSTLDLKAGYWQIAMHPNSMEKTAFVTHNGHYEYTVMPFGLKNAPSDFQRLMEIILHDLNWKICLVYIDDIIVFSKTFEEHLENLQLVFTALENANLRLKPKKCAFLKPSIQFLGYVISEKGIEVDPEKVRAVQETEYPKDVKQLQQFLGMVQWLRRFVPNLAHHASPLYQALKKDEPFEKTPEREAAFQKLKDLLITPPVLRFPVYKTGCDFLIQTDASGSAVGAVLMQQDQNEKWTISYVSRQLIPAERNYSATERECLALVFAFKKFRHYVWGFPVKLESDHASLSWMKTAFSGHNRIQKWATYLDQFDYTISYIPGKQNEAADYLSRAPSHDVHAVATRQAYVDAPSDDEDPADDASDDADDDASDGPNGELDADTEDDDDMQVEQPVDPNLDPEALTQDSDSDIGSDLEQVADAAQIPGEIRSQVILNPELKVLLAPQNIVKLQSEDNFCAKIITLLAKNPASARVVDVFFMHNQCLWRIHHAKLDGKTYHQLVLPQTLVVPVLHQFHGVSITAHFGHVKVHKTISMRYWWPAMMTKIAEWIDSCPECQRTKIERIPKTPLTSIDVVGPWDTVALDVLSVKPSAQGNINVVVFCDYYTKYIVAEAVSDIKADTIVRLFIEKVICRFGEPRRLLTDQGSSLTGEFMQDVCKIMQIKKIQTTSYHPQTDGLVERMNRTLIAQLKRLSIKDPTNWEEYLQYAVFAINASPQESTKFTPYFLMHGREPTFALDNLALQRTAVKSDITSYAYRLIQTLSEAKALVLENIAKAQKRQKRVYDKRARPKEFEIGQYVLWRKPKNRKLDPDYFGPYMVKKVDDIPPNTIIIANPDDPERTFHTSLHRVKKFYFSALRI